MARNHRRAPKKSRFTKTEAVIVQRINEIISPHGVVTGLGPEAVAVMGDGRYVGLAVTVKFLPDADYMVLSSMISNRVRGIARVLMDI